MGKNNEKTTAVGDDPKGYHYIGILEKNWFSVEETSHRESNYWLKLKLEVVDNYGDLLVPHSKKIKLTPMKIFMRKGQYLSLVDSLGGVDILSKVFIGVVGYYKKYWNDRRDFFVRRVYTGRY